MQPQPIATIDENTIPPTRADIRRLHFGTQECATFLWVQEQVRRRISHLFGGHALVPDDPGPGEVSPEDIQLVVDRAIDRWEDLGVIDLSGLGCPATPPSRVVCAPDLEERARRLLSEPYATTDADREWLAQFNLSGENDY